MDNLFTIIEAWKIANKPTEKQSQLANLRAKICDSCPSKKFIIKEKEWSAICDSCGCPLNKKVFTNAQNPCPLKKWEEVDKPFFKDGFFLDQKKKKSLY